jgi:hypothetical protein
VVNTEAERRATIARIGALVKKIAARRLARAGGDHRSDYGEIMKQVYADVKDIAGVGPEVSIDRDGGVRDQKLLQAVLRAAERLALKEGVEW